MAYPLPAFHFKVEWGGTQMAFSEVTGLNIEVQVIEYRDGLSPEPRYS
ncbi:MAG: phage tail protein, partial [Candidatus Electrothrix sp. ATG1]|nr:phage tail protein [Candidatus Electrothrix sp. ATG1]